MAERDVDPRQCKTCKWRGKLGMVEAGIFCDLLYYTGISRITHKPFVDEQGLCRWYKAENDSTPYQPPAEEAMVIQQPAQPEAPKKPGARRGRRSFRVAQISADGTVMRVFNGVMSASEATGVHPMTVHQQCNWKRQPPNRHAGAFGRRGYAFRYVFDDDYKEAIQRFLRGEDKDGNKEK